MRKRSGRRPPNSKRQGSFASKFSPVPPAQQKNTPKARHSGTKHLAGQSRPHSSRPHPSTRPQHNGKDIHLPEGRAVIGLHSAREALKVRPHSIREVWLKEGADRIPDLNLFAEWGAKHSRPVHFHNENQLNKLATSHQGVCLWVTETPKLNLDDFSADDNTPTVILALDEISDPHNVGALLRTAWLFEVKAVIVPDHRAAHLTPSVIKVASGGAEHVPLHVTHRLSDELTTLKEKGFWIYGLAGEGQQTLPQTKFHEKVVLVIGAEDKGLRSTTRNVCDELVRIPQVDPDASFNASVAGSIAVYEVQRQWLNPLK